MATQQSTARPASPQTPSSPFQSAALTERAIALVAEHPEYAPALAAFLGIEVKPAGAAAAPSDTPAAPARPASAAAARPVPSTPASSPGMLQSPAARLFRRGYGQLNGIAELPFVQEAGSGEITMMFGDLPIGMRSYWVEPSFGEDNEGYDQAHVFGKRAAAAYFLNLQMGDAQIPLHKLLEDMFADPANHTAARIAFCSYLSRLMWLHGQQLSVAQIAADVEAVLLEDAAREHQDDDAMEVR